MKDCAHGQKLLQVRIMSVVELLVNGFIHLPLIPYIVKAILYLLMIMFQTLQWTY